MQDFMDWISEWFGSLWTNFTNWQKGWLQWLLEKAEEYQTSFIYSWIVEYAAPFFESNVTTNPDGTVTVGAGGYALVDMLTIAFDTLSNYFQFLNWIMPLQEVVVVLYLYYNTWIVLRPVKAAAHLVARFLF